MGSTANVDTENIIPTTEEHLPEDIRQLLEECKKKRDEEDLKAALASIKVDRRGKVTKIKEIDFTSISMDASTEAIPNVSDSSSGVTLKHVKNLLAERDVQLVNLLSSKMLIAAGKQPEVTIDTSLVSTAVTTDTSVSQPSATLPVTQPQYGMLLNYFGSQTVMPTKAMVAQQTYSDPITSIPSSPNFI